MVVVVAVVMIVVVIGIAAVFESVVVVDVVSLSR